MRLCWWTEWKQKWEKHKHQNEAINHAFILQSLVSMGENGLPGGSEAGAKILHRFHIFCPCPETVRPAAPLLLWTGKAIVFFIIWSDLPLSHLPCPPSTPVFPVLQRMGWGTGQDLFHVTRPILTPYWSVSVTCILFLHLVLHKYGRKHQIHFFFWTKEKNAVPRYYVRISIHMGSTYTPWYNCIILKKPTNYIERPYWHTFSITTSDSWSLGGHIMSPLSSTMGFKIASRISVDDSILSWINMTKSVLTLFSLNNQ